MHTNEPTLTPGAILICADCAAHVTGRSTGDNTWSARLASNGGPAALNGVTLNSACDWHTSWSPCDICRTPRGARHCATRPVPAFTIRRWTHSGALEIVWQGSPEDDTAPIAFVEAMRGPGANMRPGDRLTLDRWHVLGRN